MTSDQVRNDSLYSQDDLEAHLLNSQDFDPDISSSMLDSEINEDRLRLSSYAINPLFARRDTKAMKEKEESLRSIKLFPVFGDDNLAKISLNYFLYLEFFHMAIRMFFFVFAAAFIIQFYYEWVGDIVFEKKEEYLLYCAALGVFCTFLLRISLHFQDKRLLEHSFLYEFQWSEEQFSILAEGIPLSATRKDVKDYFNSLIETQSFSGRVIDVIFLQDYYIYDQVKKNLAIISKKLKINQTSSLLKKEERLKTKLSQIEQDLLAFKNFKGKAIIIFDTVQTQNSIFNHLKTGWCKSLFLMCFPSCFKTYHLNRNRISVQELPEPQSLIFANLHYSTANKAFKTVLAYIMSFIVVLGIIFIITELEFQKSLNSHGKTTYDNPLIPYLFIIGTFIASEILEKIYEISMRLLPHTDAKDKKLRTFNFQIYVSFLVYGLIQVCLGNKDEELLRNQVIKLSFMFALKAFLKKFIQIFVTKNPIKNLFVTDYDTNRIKKKIAQKVVKWSTKFEFTKGLGSSLPILFIGIAFLSASRVLVLSITMITLYLVAVLDKYRMIKCCRVVTIKSASFMLKHFGVYRYTAFTSFVFTLFISALCASDVDITGDIYKTLGKVYICAFIGMFYSLCCCPRPLHLRVKDRFLEKNGFVQYESVCQNFSSFYQREDPLNKIKNQK